MGAFMGEQGSKGENDGAKLEQILSVVLLPSGFGGEPYG